MMKKKIWAFLLAAAFLLAGCRRQAPPPEDPAPAPPVPPPETRQEEDVRSITLEKLTVEGAVEWAEADRMLSRLGDLSRLLEDALAACGCTIEEPVIITIGTAGGITAQALGEGGVDAALLPETDFEEMEGKGIPVLTCPENGMVAAVTAVRPELAGEFLSSFASALTETQEGQEFIDICYPGAVFALPA